MGALNFKSQLKSSIASAYYDVKYVSYYICEAQKLYNAGQTIEARHCLKETAELLRKAGKRRAAREVEHFVKLI